VKKRQSNKDTTENTGIKVITVASEKGGVGKTTSAVQIAGLLAQQGKTLLVDADDRLESATEWLEANSSYVWGFDHCLFANWDLEAAYDWVVLDTKGGEGPQALATLAQRSHLLIVPTKPDGISARGLIKTNFRVLLTDIPPAPNTDGLALRGELESAGIPVFAQGIRHAIAASKAASLGTLIRDAKDRYSKTVNLEYEMVVKEILKLTSSSKNVEP
jgi:chromosome partitioning protein